MREGASSDSDSAIAMLPVQPCPSGRGLPPHANGNLMPINSKGACIAHVLAFAFTTGSVNAANTPAVQAELEKFAAMVASQKNAALVVSETIITDQALEIRYRAAEGLNPDTVGREVKAQAASWTQSLCSSSGISELLARTASTISLSFEVKPGVYEVQSRVSSASCPKAAVQSVRKPSIDIYAKKPTPQQVEATVKRQLIDPDSAKIYDVRYLPNGACGYVNSKNRFGGYAGQKGFVVKNTEHGFIAVIQDYISPKICENFLGKN